MPKKPVKEVLGIRIELQETERAALEASLVANGIAGILSSLGSALSPFSGAITALTVAWIADDFSDNAKAYLDKIVGRNRARLASDANQSYKAITAYLYPLSWESFDYEDAGKFKKGPDGKKTTIPEKWMRQRFQSFMNQTKQTMFISEMERQNLTPSEAWSLFYPYDEMENEAIYNFNQAARPYLGWLFPE